MIHDPVIPLGTALSPPQTKLCVTRDNFMLALSDLCLAPPELAMHLVNSSGVKRYMYSMELVP